MRGWIPLLAGTTLMILFSPPTWPRWAFMWSMAAVIYGGCKWLTWRRTPVQRIPVWRHVGYLMGWPGLDPVAFLEPRADAASFKPTIREWLFAASKTAIGFTFLFVIAPWVPREYPYVAGWVGMTGIIMVLHFGTFHLLSCAWRAGGVEARPLMNWPLAAESLSDFWGRRWNTAFRDLTHRFLFRPLAARMGPRLALCAGFVFSGILHDLVISIPARGGYGGPSLFFTLQGLAMFFERSRVGRRMSLARGWTGWLFAALMLLAPVGLLFHKPFVVGIIVPFMNAIGAIR